ncbi:Imm8 family immunity protein [Testudinibacter sp. P80/BLE/0925]|uniref:Imm8 family immunity protein n=1 Tax=Testudinibacter sp. TW-1 TaxID=3417757 RepID=UPI003D361B1E
MKAELKLITDLFGEFSPAEYIPINNDVFHITLLLGIGGIDGEAMDYFDVSICTLEWVRLNNVKPVILNNTILVDDYDFNKILKYINECINLCDGKNWYEVANNLSKFFLWEYDRYKTLSTVKE